MPLRHPLSLLAAWIFVLLAAWPSLAAELDAARALTATHALSGGEFTLGDGRNVRLEGIAAPMPETDALAATARHALDTLAAGKEIVLENAAPDRYGRVVAQVYAAGDNGTRIWIQPEMLRMGLAFVYPLTGDEPNLDALLAAENEARTAKRGIWADPFYADTPADKAWPKLGHFAFVRGKVIAAERVKEKVYLRFGEDWHKDFTVAIAAHDFAAFRRAGVDPLSYEGKTVRVRGWVMRDGGPAIMVNTPAQIEILNP